MFRVVSSTAAIKEQNEDNPGKKEKEEKRDAERGRCSEGGIAGESIISDLIDGILKLDRKRGPKSSAAV